MVRLETHANSIIQTKRLIIVPSGRLMIISHIKIIKTITTRNRPRVELVAFVSVGVKNGFDIYNTRKVPPVRNANTSTLVSIVYVGVSC